MPEEDLGLEPPLDGDFPPDDADVGNDGAPDSPVERLTPNAEARGWGAGWPHCSTARVVTAIAGKNGLRLPVRQEIAPLVQWLVRDLEARRGSPFRSDWSWGFACREIKGTTTPSNHSWGLAIDLDAPENAQQPGATPPGRNTMPPDASALAESYGFRWGGTYSRSPDPMHFEYMETPEDARRRASGGAPGHDDPQSGGGSEDRVPYPGPPPLRRGSRGAAVLRVQQALDVDYSSGPGVFGPRTEEAVKEFQRQKGLQVDGIVGTRTWGTLFP